MLKNNPFNPNIFISEHLKNSPYTKLDYESFRPIPQKIVDKDLKAMGFLQTIIYMLFEVVFQFFINFAKSFGHYFGKYLGITIGAIFLILVIFYGLIIFDKRFNFKNISLPGNIKLER